MIKILSHELTFINIRTYFCVMDHNVKCVFSVNHNLKCLKNALLTNKEQRPLVINRKL